MAYEAGIFNTHIFILQRYQMTQAIILLKKSKAISFMHMSVLPIWMYVYNMHDWCPQRSEGGIDSLEIGVTDGCDVPSGF